jgi:glycine betaine/proline transport system ATP-binding protein
VDISTVLTAGDVASRQQTTVIEREGTGIEAAIERLHKHDRECGYVVGKGLKFLGVATIDDLKRQRDTGGDMAAAVHRDVKTVIADTPLNEMISDVADAPFGLPVVDQEGRYKGVVTRAALLRTLDRESEEPHV